jgi:VIT1/CCC1 family predicted Fe2+/Mn2+ transporter
VTESEHQERHFQESEFIRDIVIGMADGLTVPFALAAGISGAVANTQIVVTAGTAEICAGAIAMGLGGYLAARTESEHYHSEVLREEREIKELPANEREEIVDIIRGFGVVESQVTVIADAISADHERWLNFMMKQELGLDKPDPKRAKNSSLTIGASYVVGGLIPLAPYIFLRSSHIALLVSIVFTLIALMMFGLVKGYFTGQKPWKSGWQTTVVGGLAAAVAYLIARWIA